jgi:hypothetical protein
MFCNKTQQIVQVFRAFTHKAKEDFQEISRKSQKEVQALLLRPQVERMKCLNTTAKVRGSYKN